MTTSDIEDIEFPDVNLQEQMEIVQGVRNAEQKYNGLI
ncbi:hypothetical protein BACIH_0661 [Bacillus amyloliquefaciens]|nr:hypothetical protein U471_06880 [Bacillus amyloliquefaciens CC178]QEY88984.1 hypothetical protein BACIT_1043 [Bacillus amyloliquefaciens]QEY92441.1 hypothetical protein BACIH_0661 [Bacillus amyloliquefaciens]